jgi:hypothetical protein
MSIAHLPPPVRPLVLVYKGQGYRLLSSEVVRRRDGEETTLLTWESRCAECGDSFLFTTPARASKFQPNRRCHRHKRPGQRVRGVQG